MFKSARQNAFIVTLILIITAIMLNMGTCFAKASLEGNSDAYDIEIDNEDYIIRARNVTFTFSELGGMDEEMLQTEIITRSEPVVYLTFTGELWRVKDAFADVSVIKKEVKEEGYDVGICLWGDHALTFFIKVFVVPDISPVAPVVPERPHGENKKKENRESDMSIKVNENADAQSVTEQKVTENNSDSVPVKEDSPINEIKHGDDNKKPYINIAILFYILTAITLLSGGKFIYSDIKLLKWCGWRRVR